MNDRAAPVANDKLYEEIGRTWQFFASWRDKLFAGYLSAIAALAFAFSKSPCIPVRAGLFASGILLSLVFRILDYRTTYFINFCELEAAKLADWKGFFGEFTQERFEKTNHSGFAKAVKKLGFAKALNILVAIILGACVTGLFFYLLRWGDYRCEFSLCWAFVGLAPCIGSYLCLDLWSGVQFSEAKERYLAELLKASDQRKP
jgi:hypothetical protein